MKRSTAENQTSRDGTGTRPRDSDAEIVDESELLDEADWAIEQLVAGVIEPAAAVPDRPTRASVIRPRAPGLLDESATAEASATWAALARFEAGATRTEVSPPTALDAPPSPPALAPAAAHPPPGPLPPVPTPPASLRDPLRDPPLAAGVGDRPSRKRRKPRDRWVELPSYPPGAVTVRTSRPAPLAAPAARRPGAPWGWLAALVAVGIGGYASGRLGAFEPPRAVKSLPRAAIAAAVLDGPRLDDAAADDSSARARDAAAERGTSETLTAASAIETRAPATEPRARREARPTAASEVETLSIAPPTPSNQMDANAASAALARAGARAMSCTDARGGEGTVSVTFLPSGSPVDVRMGGAYAGTAVGVCVEQIFRAARVSPFEGAATTVYYRVRLPGDGKPIN